MGKHTGFMDYRREIPNDLDPLDRILHWKEFHLSFQDAKLRAQGARCMDCGVPFCHTGSVINGMASGCPIHNLIPEWNDLVYRGLWEQALKRLLMTNNFPEITGRVCPAPCEGSCTLNLIDKPVTIKHIELAIIEKGFDEGWIKPEPPSFRSGKKVAIIGSGPSGMACADLLNRAGHTVTVFERADRIGGLLMYGIPNMKLSKKVLQRRINLLMAEGIHFELNTEVGGNYPAERLLKAFDATVLCGGATNPRDLQVPGRSCKGIYFAMEFLKANTRNLLDESVQAETYTTISARNKHVVVIGGGDTGTDCVATALRHGCQSVVQFELMDQQPSVRSKDNPWPEWPKIRKMDYGQEEAIAIYGQNPQQYRILTKNFEADADGNVKTVHTVRVLWQLDSEGRPFSQEIPGSDQIWQADLVLLALGFLGPEAQLLDQLNIERNRRNNVMTDAERYATNIPGIFSAGDMRRGQSLVVWAIHEGRGAAREVDRYLMGDTKIRK